MYVYIRHFCSTRSHVRLPVGRAGSEDSEIHAHSHIRMHTHALAQDDGWSFVRGLLLRCLGWEEPSPRHLMQSCLTPTPHPKKRGPALLCLPSQQFPPPNPNLPLVHACMHASSPALDINTACRDFVQTSRTGPPNHQQTAEVRLTLAQIWGQSTADLESSSKHIVISCRIPNAHARTPPCYPPKPQRRSCQALASYTRTCCFAVMGGRAASAGVPCRPGAAAGGPPTPHFPTRPVASAVAAGQSPRRPGPLFCSPDKPHPTIARPSLSHPAGQ